MSSFGKKLRSFHFLSTFTFRKGMSKFLLSAKGLTCYHTVMTLKPLRKKPFENVVEKGDNDSNQHFLLFPKCFLP